MLNILCLSIFIFTYDIFVYFFFFKQKTAYEMRISDWSSDVCSSDLVAHPGEPRESLRPPTHRDAQSRDLGQPARHQPGARIVARAHTVAHADRERGDILEHPAEFAAQKVGVGVDETQPPMEHSLALDHASICLHPSPSTHTPSPTF